ncbi:MAG TPA: MOSC domain-containing protein [Solirubrobacteraceae bacterium]
MGEVAAIAVATRDGELPAPVERVRAHAGRGLEGEYHLAPERAEPGAAITLIAEEALDGLRADTGIALTHAETRRNVLTRGVDLNALVGRRFRVGEVECEGVELCEPCLRLARMVDEFGVLRGLVHRGGLRADVLSDGEIAVGDPVEPLLR